MFQFRRFPSYTYGFSIWYHNMTYGGLLHSVIPGSKSAYDSPRHFVVSHDLLRLPMPRHSLCALCSLTIELCFDSRLNFEIVVIYPKFFLEYLTRFLICIYFHCSVFKIPCVASDTVSLLLSDFVFPVTSWHRNKLLWLLRILAAASGTVFILFVC